MNRVLWILLLFSSLFASKPTSYFLGSLVNYQSNIPDPSDFYENSLGTKHLFHHQILGYFDHLTALSGRIKSVRIGTSHEGRPLKLYIISSAKNIARIDAIQELHLNLTNPRFSDELDLEQMQAVVFMGYSVHGNEASGSHASVMLAYHLVAGMGPEHQEHLDNLVVIIDPCLNPDGFDRFVQWVNQYQGKVTIADRYHKEHNEAWPGGRSNHYFFDLNRDWLPVQQPESRARVRFFHEWKPNVLTDYHETGTQSTYFFQPGVPTRNHPLIPKSVFNLTETFAKYYSNALDEIKAEYFSHEVFDDFYFGKGSTYPDINGGIGILFEQASSRGQIQERYNSSIDFSFGIRNHVRTSLATIHAAFERRLELLQHQKWFFQSSDQLARKQKTGAFVLKCESDFNRLDQFVQILELHNLQSFVPGKEIILDSHVLDKETVVVPVAQPGYRLLQAIFEERTEFPDNTFYDVSAWTLPLAFGIEVFPLSHEQLERIERSDDPLTEQPGRAFKTGRDILAFGFKWSDSDSPKLVYELLSKGYVVKVATRTFSVEQAGESLLFSPGFIVVMQTDFSARRQALDSLLTVRSQEYGLDLYAFSSMETTSGPDLGSGAFMPLQLPSIAMCAGSGVSSGALSGLWYLLDYHYRFPVTLLEPEMINKINLYRYNVLIFPSGSFRQIDEKGLNRLNQWQKDGGIILATQGSLRWLSNKEIITIDYKTNDDPDVQDKENDYDSRGKSEHSQRISGAIFMAELDPTHPIAYGYDDVPVAVMKRGTMAVKKLNNPYSMPLLYADSPLWSGYASVENQTLIANTPGILTFGFGEGRVIVYLDDPFFRGFWFGTSKLFLNGIFFGHILDDKALDMK
ncbi:zinc carboxypeptidase [candidate division KSB1 bacterium]|nr:zinc carboxypeptidase [candidate division KSB1 bacterium]